MIITLDPKILVNPFADYNTSSTNVKYIRVIDSNSKMSNVIYAIFSS